MARKKQQNRDHTTTNNSNENETKNLLSPLETDNDNSSNTSSPTNDNDNDEENNYGSIPSSCPHSPHSATTSPATNIVSKTPLSCSSKSFHALVIVFIVTCIIGLFVSYKPADIAKHFEEDDDEKNENITTKKYFTTNPPSSLGTSLSTSSTTFDTNKKKQQHYRYPTDLMEKMPYPKVDRGTYGDDVSKIMDPKLFHSSLLHPTSSSSSSFSTTTSSSSPAPFLKVPFPTGAFWTNLILHPTADHSISYPIVSYPYSYKWSPSNLYVSYPFLQRYADSISIRDTFKPDLMLNVLESMERRNVVEFDELSVGLRWFHESSSSSSSSSASKTTTTTSSSTPKKYWETYIVQGSPYTTVKYNDVTPIITPISIFKDVMCLEGSSTKEEDNSQEGVCSVLYEPPPNRTPNDSTNKTLTGTQFLLHTNENLYWLLFASTPITLSFDTITKRTISSLNTTYTGILRFALVPPPHSNGSGGFDTAKELSYSSGVKQLVYHSNVYPVGADISWDFSNSHEDSTQPNDVGTIHFMYKVESMTSSSSSSRTNTRNNLLMLSLPHHTLPNNMKLSKSTDFDLIYNCIKGKMTPVIGSHWYYNETLSSVDFDDEEAKAALSSSSTSSGSSKFDASVKKEILKQVKFDYTRVLPTLDENVYGFGKQVARLAQLVHIARRMNQVSSTSSGSEVVEEEDQDEELSSLASQGAELLHSFLTKFLANEERDKLVYDANLGGMVTMDGLKNTEADFGNGRFNDHHFHYGYILYACAIMGDINATFVSEYGDFVDPILFDVAHSSYTSSNSEPFDGAFFPLARHKSWFDGHSFASGLFPFGNGKSQESSSEAVNCYYGAYLWSMVRSKSVDDDDDSQAGSDGELVDFARLLLATEIRGAKTYWHMIPPDTYTSNSENELAVYSPTLAKNYMVGNLGMMDVTCSTWFGTEPLYVHMINFIPITAITSDLFDKSYIHEEYTNLIQKYNEVQMAWRGYVVCDEAMVNPNLAWTKAGDIYSPELDSALSRSQVLYWISTRTGFIPPSQKAISSGETSSSDSSSSSALCYKNEKCAEEGLTGECCPSSNGVFLGCCDSNIQNSDESSATASSSCTQSEKCAALGLSGECCPTAEGFYLGCCDNVSSASTKEEVSSEQSVASSSSSSSSSCSQNENCAAMGLTGDCCPAPDGVYLGCCGNTTPSSA